MTLLDCTVSSLNLVKVGQQNFCFGIQCEWVNDADQDVSCV